MSCRFSRGLNSRGASFSDEEEGVETGEAGGETLGRRRVKPEGPAIALACVAGGFIPPDETTLMTTMTVESTKQSTPLPREKAELSAERTVALRPWY